MCSACSKKCVSASITERNGLCVKVVLYQCSACSKKCVSASITQKNGLCVKVVLYCNNCDTVIGENYTSPRMESTNSRQAAFVVN